MTSVRILAVSDSDSYLKWSHALLRHAASDEGHLVHEVVLSNVLSPSVDQMIAAAGGTVDRVGIMGLVARVRALRPDAVLVSCTGPALEVVIDTLHAAGLLGPTNPGRPVLVTGFPGITVPANELALRFRRHVDLVIVHSRRELREHRALAASLGLPTRFALARLPFLPDSAEPGTAAARGAARDRQDVLFAAQSLVPAQEEQRRAILEALADVPDGMRPVVKVRAGVGERQAHNEDLPYAELDPDPRIMFRAGSMADALQRTRGFVTVSSTAVLEALAMGIPSIVLSDFGVDDAMITTVFTGSGLLGTLDDVRAGRFAHPHPDWLEDNYFHNRSDDEWLDELAHLVSEPRVPVHVEPFGDVKTRARRWVRVCVPPRCGRIAPGPLRGPRGR